MARLTSSTVLTAVSLSLVAGLAAPTTASAKQFQIAPCVLNKTCLPQKQVLVTPGFKYAPGYKKPGWGYGGPGWGYGAAALGGLAVGAIAASAASEGECFIERRRVYDEDGNVYVRRIRVCE